jgi:hypothetical protein
MNNEYKGFGNIKKLTKEDFEKACSQNNTMANACADLGIHFTSFKKYALKYNCYDPKKGKLQGGKTDGSNSIKLEDVILKGKNKGYARRRIKERLINEGYKKHKCEDCGRTKWNGKSIPLELEHVDGNGKNNLIKNLKLLCPNCHAQTSTYRGKNKKKS